MKEDFTGFSFNGVHSSELNIVRVSDGSRYNESLTPDFEDKIISVPGTDGSYYFGTQYRNKTISVSIAFDSMNERQFRQLGQLLAIKKPCSLIFDERPYKVYLAKISTSPQLNYICFDEPKKKEVQPRQGIRIINRDNNSVEWEEVTPYVYTDEKERIYKGEGTIEFACIYPYAVDQFKVLDFYGNFNFKPVWGEIQYRNNPRSSGEATQRAIEDGVDVNSQEFLTNPKYKVINNIDYPILYDNVAEWAEASGILPYEQYLRYGLDVVQEVLPASNIMGYNTCIPVYNPGNIDSPFYLFLPYTNNGINNEGTLDEGDQAPNIVVNLNNSIMVIKPFTSKTILKKENGVIINTKNHLIEGVIYDTKMQNWSTTGNIYNEHIIAGDFEKIEANNWSIYNIYNGQNTQVVYINCATAMPIIENDEIINIGARIHYNYLYY